LCFSAHISFFEDQRNKKDYKDSKELSSAEMKAPLISAFMVLLVVFSLGQEEKCTLRFLDGTLKTGYLIKIDRKGIKFRPEGTKVAIRFGWEELAPECAEELKKKYLRVEPLPKKFALDGVKIITKDGKELKGIIIERFSTDEEIFIKSAQVSKFIKRHEIKEIHKTKLDPLEVYTSEELSKILYDRILPSDAEGYERLAEEFKKLKLEAEAVRAYKLSLALRKEDFPQGRLYKDLLKLRERIANIALKETLYQAQEEYLLGEYEKVLERLNKVQESLIKLPLRDEILHELKRIRVELNLLREITKDQKIISEYSRTIDALILAKAISRELSCKEAEWYVENRLKGEVEGLIAHRFNIDKESIKIIWEKRSRFGLKKLSYGKASWLLTDPAPKEKERFWETLENNLRFNYLKGLYIQRYMEVVKVLQKNCACCGAKGVIKVSHQGEKALQCPSCRGKKFFRIIIYR
jgi:tetratricopeptide (TPR) repeat protein